MLAKKPLEFEESISMDMVRQNGEMNIVLLPPKSKT
jgi:hypothetical protein